MDEKKDKQKAPFETASATTDSDNSKSGSFAYILTAVFLGVSLLLGVIVAGCASIALSSGTGRMSFGKSSPDSMSPFDMNNDYAPYGNQDDSGMDEIEEFFEQYENELYGNPSDTNSNQGKDRTDETSKTAAPKDALDFDLAPYVTKVDDLVGANAYAGSTTEVRDFVRDFVSKDNDYAKKVVDLLNAAALSENDEGRLESLKQAMAVCDEATKTFGDLALPEVKDKKEEITASLNSAKESAQERWTQTKAELELLSSKEDIQTKQLWRVDEDIVDATEDTADYLIDALEISAGN